MGQEGHFIPKFIGPWASSGVANPSLSSHSSFWALAHSSSPSSLSRAGSFISSCLPHPLSTPHFVHRGGVRRSSRHYWWSICLDMVRGSVACGRAAGGGVRAGGDIMSHYMSWYVLFTCVHAHLRLSHRSTHVPEGGPSIVVSHSLRNESLSQGWFEQLINRARSCLLSQL